MKQRADARRSTDSRSHLLHEPVTQFDRWPSHCRGGTAAGCGAGRSDALKTQNKHFRRAAAFRPDRARGRPLPLSPPALVKQSARRASRRPGGGASADFQRLAARPAISKEQKIKKTPIGENVFSAADQKTFFPSTWLCKLFCHVFLARVRPPLAARTTG